MQRRDPTRPGAIQCCFDFVNCTGALRVIELQIAKDFIALGRVSAQCQKQEFIFLGMMKVIEISVYEIKAGREVLEPWLECVDDGPIKMSRQCFQKPGI